MNKKNNWSELKELMKTPNGKAIVFFGAYLLFFIFIAVVARVGGSSSGISLGGEYETGSSLEFSLANIESDNYKFDYEMLVDSTSYLYQGSKTKNNELFTYNSLDEYYSNNDIYFVNKGGVWVNTENPFVFKEFIDVDNIGLLIETSRYVYKTEYESGKTVYNFQLSSASISKLFENKDLDIEEEPNEIVISTDEEGLVNEIKFMLDSYCKVKSICTNGMKITLKYELYGEVSDIISPLE